MGTDCTCASYLTFFSNKRLTIGATVCLDCGSSLALLPSCSTHETACTAATGVHSLSDDKPTLCLQNQLGNLACFSASNRSGTLTLEAVLPDQLAS